MKRLFTNSGISPYRTAIEYTVLCASGVNDFMSQVLKRSLLFIGEATPHNIKNIEDSSTSRRSFKIGDVSI